MRSTLLIVISSICCLQGFSQNNETVHSGELQKWIRSEKELNRAKNNERVLLVVVTVKQDMHTAFETWIREVLYAALYKSKSEMKKAQLKVTRWLEPVRQNQDSTWTYCWIMDPVIPNTDYDILTFLKNEYGSETGTTHWNTYLTFMAQEPLVVGLKQTDY